MRLDKRIRRWLGLDPAVAQSPAIITRGRVDHVIIFDGTMSSLKAGCETNAGLTYKLIGPDPRRGCAVKAAVFAL